MLGRLTNVLLLCLSKKGLASLNCKTHNSKIIYKNIEELSALISDKYT